MCRSPKLSSARPRGRETSQEVSCTAPAAIKHMFLFPSLRSTCHAPSEGVCHQYIAHKLKKKQDGKHLVHPHSSTNNNLPVGPKHTLFKPQAFCLCLADGAGSFSWRLHTLLAAAAGVQSARGRQGAFVWPGHHTAPMRLPVAAFLLPGSSDALVLHATVHLVLAAATAAATP